MGYIRNEGVPGTFESSFVFVLIGFMIGSLKLPIDQ